MSLFQALTRWSRSLKLTTSCRRYYSLKKPITITEAFDNNVSASKNRLTDTRPGRVHGSTPISSPSTSKIDLPPISEWGTYFPNQSPLIRDRVSLRNPETASAVAEAFVPGDKSSGDKVIIEAFPGPGALTRALLRLPKDRIRKLIVLEDYEPYLEYLKPLEQIDSRVHVVPLNGFSWDAYVTIDSLGLLDDVQSVPWDGGVHPQLQFVSHLPQTIHGEQLIAQFLRGIPPKSWLFKYGRMPMGIVMSDWVWQRISPIRKYITRCKLSVIAEAVSEFHLALPSQELQPYDEHFHPVYMREAPRDGKIHRHAGSPCQAVNFVPREQQVIGPGMLDKWDFCLRRLFVLKSKSLKSAVPHLCPGSQVLLKDLTNPDLLDHERLDIKKPIREMTVDDWAIFVRAFDRWPFAPEDLAISDPLSENKRK